MPHKFEYMLLTPDGAISNHVVEFAGREPTYVELQELIEPLIDHGNLEHISVLFDGERSDMFVDEDGHSKGLPINKQATLIYWNYTMQSQKLTAKDMVMRDAGTVVGTAILFRKRVWS